MSNTYRIESWNPIGNNIKICPSLYIKPDMNFMDILRKNNWRVLCKISNTNTSYDGHTYVANVNTSGNVPNCRPNFFDKTGFYIITLTSNADVGVPNTIYWLGYPENNGEIEILDRKI